MSHPQKRIWYNEQIHPGTAAHNIGGIALCHGPLDLRLLEQALLLVIRKHVALRLQLTESNGEVRQYIQEATPAALEHVDLSAADDPQAALEALTDRMFRQPMPLLDSPLYQFVLVKLGPARSAYIAKLHHLVADGWSVRILSEESSRFYEQLAAGEDADAPADASYLDGLAREAQYAASPRCARDKSFWNETLAGFGEAFRGTNGEGTAGQRKRFMLEKTLSARANAFASAHKLSLNALFAALLLIDLHKQTQQSDLLLGNPVFNRSGAKEKSTFGMFTSTMPLRMQVEPELGVAELVERVQAMLTKCLFHQKYPYDRLAQDLELAKQGYDSLFHIGVNYYNTKLKLEIGGAEVENVEWYSGEQFDSLQLTIKEWTVNGQVELQLDYKLSVYTDRDIEQLKNRLCLLLEQVLDAPETRVRELRTLSAAEREQLVDRFNRTEAEYPREQTIHEVIAEQVRRTPDAVALRAAGETISYRELHERSNCLARTLTQRGVQRGTVVGLYAQHTPETVVAILAVCKAGGAYLPIDPTTPADRISYVLTDSGAALLLTDGQLPEGVSFAGDVFPLTGEPSDHADTSDLPPISGPDDLVYVIYTSGSTGKPKGTMIEHRGLVNYAWWASRRYLTQPDDVFALYSSLAFDLTVTSIFAPLVSGHTIAVYQEREGEFPLERILSDGIANVIKLTPAHLSLLIGQADGLGKVRRFIVGGEDLKTSLARGVEATFGAEVEILNEYGPTETVVGCMIHRYDRARDLGASVPIGTPIDNVQIYVLDPYLEPVPVGVVGELYVSGDGVARGYLNRPALNEERFLPNPFRPGTRMYRTGDLARHGLAGLIEYCGRTDDQVKIRGYRIERGEIEQQLIALPTVREAVVADFHPLDESPYLAAYLVLEQATSSFELRRALTEVLPSYMVPSYFVQIDELPLTHNGKVDRKRLPDPSVAHLGAGEMPLADEAAEALLIDVLQDVLRMESLTPSDNFYRIGGDSIKAIQVTSRLAEAGYSLQVKDMLAYPVIREMAAMIRTQHHPVAPQTPATGVVGRTPIAAWFDAQALANPHHFNQSVLLQMKATVSAEQVRDCVQALVRHHDALRLLREAATGALVYQDALLTAEPAVDVHDLSGLSPAEQQVQLDMLGTAAKGSLHLERGPLFRAVLFELGAGEQRLLFTAHHLLVDGVSWQVLLGDFERLLCGESLAPKSHAVHMFAERLAAYAEAISPTTEAYWREAVDRVQAFRLPEQTGGASGRSNIVQLDWSLPHEQTSALLTVANTPYGTQTQELLLTALALACRANGCGEQLTFELEGHGRELAFDELDVSRTVGWFTTMYPLNVSLPAGGVGDVIKHVKEQVRAVPNKGFDYGVLTRLTDRLPVVEQPVIRFNYLGELDNAFRSEQFAVATERTGPESAPENGLTCPLEVVALVTGRQLQVTLTGSDQQMVAAYATALEQSLQNVLAHCSGKQEVDYTPSDFETADVTQEDLDDLFV